MPTKRIKHLIAIALLPALVALAAVTLTSGAEPDPDTAKQRAAKQRVAIVSKGVENASGSGEFVLTPLEAGALMLEWVDAGNGYHVSSSTWKVVRGTGQYAQITGGGRGGGMWLDRGPGPWSGRSEGFLTLPS